MNRFVSLLLVALSLAAVSLARPAQAQWVKGQPYYNPQNSAPVLVGNTTFSSSPIGTVTLTSNSVYGSNASGSFSGSVMVDYTWQGSADSNTGGFSCTHGAAVSGSAVGGSANSTAGSSDTNGVYGTSVGSPGPDSSYFMGRSQTHTYILNTNPVPKTFTLSAPLTTNTNIFYKSTATASAAFTFGAPIVPQP